MKPIVGDLFSGAGLFSQAFRAEGARIKFAVELDRCAAASYARNIGPHVMNRSVEEIGQPPKVDIIVAGPPCQGFSTLGRRDPKDARNRLCLVIPHWLKATGAQVCVVENVPQFLSSSYWERMCARLSDIGYEVTSWCLDAADFGVPQHRKRSFTVASRIGLPEKPSGAPQRAAAAQAFRRVARTDPMHVWPEPSPLMASRLARLPPKGDRRDLLRTIPELCPPSWRRLGAQATDVWGRLDSSRPANTIRCDFQNPSKGRYVHPFRDRMISLREGARLQQVDDGWIFEGHRTAITRQIGNGVPLGLGRAVASQIFTLF